MAASLRARELVEQHNAEFSETIRNWFVEDLGPMGLTSTQADAWKITPESIISVSVPSEELRLVDDQSCIEQSGRLPEETHVITTLYGARVFEFETNLPVDYDLQQEMLRVVLMENMTLESDAFFVYEPALNGGEHMTNHKDELLYIAPDGGRIPDAVRAEQADFMGPLHRCFAVALYHQEELVHTLRGMRREGQAAFFGRFDTIPQQVFGAGVDLHRQDNTRQAAAFVPLHPVDQF